MEDCETGVLTETGCGASERNQKLLSPVMSKWYASCIVIRLEKEQEPESWKKLHVGGIIGISGRHLQVMMTNLLQKRWEWQGDRTPMLRHGSVVRSTCNFASMGIKTAFDDARPRHVAKIMESHNTHGWIIASLLREMDGLEGQAMFGCVESNFSFC